MPSDCVEPMSASMSRLQAGLPASGTIFCCFNAPYKFNPGTFDLWMRILREVQNSILWLREAPDIVKSNLAHAAEKRSLDPSRLLYAPRLPTLAEHYARLSLADLFLDTYPYNAHVTAIDALVAGVPVITLRGSSFASRVATSLLHGVQLPHLSVETADDYAQRAIELGREPAAIAELKAHLRRMQANAPLYDPKRFCRHLETAFVEISARHERGEAPSPLWVQPAHAVGHT
jgi:predicted O-linked N-acetylglucosamine transferase (SPINDLY family)